MPDLPKFAYALGSGEPVVTPADSLWNTPLPMDRTAFSQERTSPSGHITYGDYFSAAHHYLIKDNMAVVGLAIQQLFDTPDESQTIDGIRINLLKHGAFYHPSQVVVTCGRHQIQLVLNVAVSDLGRQCLSAEYANLERLNQEMTNSYLPCVFGRGRGDTPGGESLPMFCGQWLQNYYEFHLTGGTENNPLPVVLWDTDAGTAPLDAKEVNTLLQQAARILAYYFNPITCEAILDWHHSAGDFVVRRKSGKIEVALITVRRYAAMIESKMDPDDPDLEILLNAWLVFLMHISLRLRLDRLDGVGDPVCYGDEVLGAIYQGFWQGLEASFQERGLPAELLDGARSYFARFQLENLLEVAEAMLQHLVFQPAEAQLLKGMVATHIQQLNALLCQDQSTT